MRIWLILAAGLLTGCSSVGGPAMPFMSTKGYAFAPEAFYRFCSQEPGLCNTQGSPQPVLLTAARRSQLREVNRRVNRSVAQTSDGSAGSDRWGLPRGGAGDCEDLAILKKAELVRRGWPASTLLLAVATQRSGGHTLLVVRTDGGDLILDNLTNRILPWSDTHYRFHARQRPGSTGEDWERISSGKA